MVSKRKRMRLIWRKMGLLKLAFLAAIIVILFFLMFLFVDTESNYTSTNILVFIVVNLNIIALGVMTFLIGRNITKLFFDRKNKVSGAKLRSRLVLAFVGMTLVPTCLVFLIASKILSTAIDRWFYSQTESLYTSAVDVAKFHYHSISEHASLIAQWISDEIKSNQDKYKIPSELHAFLEAERKQNKVFTIALYNRSHQKIDYVYNVVATIPDLADPQPDEEYLSQAFDSLKPIDNLESLGANKFVRVYFPVKWYKQDLLLLITMRLNPELSTKLMLIDDAYREHEQLKFYNRPIQSGYLLTLSMITALIIFSAIWIGFYIAREITNPIKKLAEGTRAIAKGDYDFKLRERGDDEVSSLVKAFNIMTRDLKASRVEVEMRRLYLESILARLAVAVIALDKDGNVNSFNQAAIRLFDLSNDVYNVHLHELLSPVELAQIEALLRCIDDESVHASEREMEILTNGRLRKVIATAGSIVDSNGVRLGSVLVFDDITEGTEYSDYINNDKWNKGCYDLRLKRAVSVIKSLSSDILILEEVENKGVLESIDALLKQKGGFFAGFRYGAFYRSKGCGLGVGLLSKIPIKDIKIHEVYSDDNAPLMRAIVEQ